jgi:hypothetical protein
VYIGGNVRGAVDHDPVRLEPGQAADVRLICKGDPHCVSVLDVQLVVVDAEDAEKVKQSLDDWMEGYEAAVESGQSRITRAEAERRFHQQNKDD